jgi:hypothetical protein
MRERDRPLSAVLLQSALRSQKHRRMTITPAEHGHIAMKTLVPARSAQNTSICFYPVFSNSNAP